jgi:hypothetical protein
MAPPTPLPPISMAPPFPGVPATPPPPLPACPTLPAMLVEPPLLSPLEL